MPGTANRSVERTKGVNTPSRSTASPAASQHPSDSLLYAVLTSGSRHIFKWPLGSQMRPRLCHLPLSLLYLQDLFQGPSSPPTQ